MNFSHDINVIKGKEVTDEMLLALANVPKDFDILAPIGVEYDYSEEELHISLLKKSGELEVKLKLTMIVRMK